MKKTNKKPLTKTKQKQRSLDKVDRRNATVHRTLGNTNWVGFLALFGIILAIISPNIYILSLIGIPAILRILFIIVCVTFAWQLGMRKSSGSRLLPTLAIIVGLLGVFFLMYET